MSCVVGIVDQGKIWMGADSAMTERETVLHTKESKVFKFGRRMIIGCAGTLRDIQAIKYTMRPPNHPKRKSDREYLVTYLIPTIINVLVVNGIIRGDDPIETNNQFIIGYRGNLYVTDSVFSIDDVGKYGAIGAGEQFALGSLMNSKGNPESRIRRALKTACRCYSVRPPFVIDKL